VAQDKFKGMKQNCPRCKKPTKVKKIIYGMPSDDFNFEKYEVGGCCIEENSPTHLCTECGKKFLTKSQSIPDIKTAKD
jgi:hypothetical protein